MSLTHTGDSHIAAHRTLESSLYSDDQAALKRICPQRTEIAGQKRDNEFLSRIRSMNE